MEPRSFLKLMKILLTITYRAGAFVNDCKLLGDIEGYPSSKICAGGMSLGRSVLIDMYDTNDVGLSTCSCTALIISPSGTTSLSLSSFRDLGPNSGCKSSLEIQRGTGEKIVGQCNYVTGSLTVQDGDVITVILNRQQQSESRYCLSLTLDNLSSTINATCSNDIAATPPPTTTQSTTPAPTTQSTTPAPTTQSTTTKPATTQSTMPKPTTTQSTTPAPTTTQSTTPAPTTTQSTTPKPTTQSTTPAPATTQSTTPPPTTTQSTTPPPTTTQSTTPPLTTTQSTTPKPTTQSTTPKPTTQSTTPKPTTQSTTPKPTTQSTTPKPTTQSTTPKPTTQSTTPKPTTQSTTTKPTTTQSTTPIPTTTQSNTQTSTTPQPLNNTVPASSPFSTSGTKSDGNNEEGIDTSHDTLNIIIPTIVGAFVLFVLVLVIVVHCRSNRRSTSLSPKSFSNPEYNRFTPPKLPFTHASHNSDKEDMKEIITYDQSSLEDQSYSAENTRLDSVPYHTNTCDNPLFDNTTNSDISFSESSASAVLGDKRSTGSSLQSNEADTTTSGQEAPCYAVVNKQRGNKMTYVQI
ncbi:mucin-2-like [Ylistrum balloti]|uniref:mucin-2-like n=1 Tax=Ylistrum balloti TaxID=509963 RepID=UPI002905D8EA|nr:mucin-2-like [Ylistrum balloti]